MALRDLGIAADLLSDGARATAIMTRAALRGRRDSATQGWWLQRALASGDAQSAVWRLDAMLRSQPQLEPQLLPVISALVSLPVGRLAWAQSLVANPPWRAEVLDGLAAKDPDVGSVGQLFADLERRRSPPTDAQLGVVLTRIALAGGYADASSLWAASVGRGDSTALYDGGFRQRAGQPPFNWQIIQPESGVVAMVTRPGQASALVATYP